MPSSPQMPTVFYSRAEIYADDYLYGLSKDPWQFNNVVKDPAFTQVKENLRSDLLSWIEKVEGCQPVIRDKSYSIRAILARCVMAYPLRKNHGRLSADS